MVVQLHPEALEEYMEAVAFYEERAPDLGRDFLKKSSAFCEPVGTLPPWAVRSLRRFAASFAGDSRSR